MSQKVRIVFNEQVKFNIDKIEALQEGIKAINLEEISGLDEAKDIIKITNEFILTLLEERTELLKTLQSSRTRKKGNNYE